MKWNSDPVFIYTSLKDESNEFLSNKFGSRCKYTKMYLYVKHFTIHRFARGKFTHPRKIQAVFFTYSVKKICVKCKALEVFWCFYIGRSKYKNVIRGRYDNVLVRTSWVHKHIKGKVSLCMNDGNGSIKKRKHTCQLHYIVFFSVLVFAWLY